MIDLLFINICSTRGVHPETTRAIIREESGFREWAININKPKDIDENPQRAALYDKLIGELKAHPPASKDEAVKFAKTAIDSKFSIDLGVMQINSSNFKPYLMSIEDALDPCRNIRVGTDILKRFYDHAEQSMGSGQETLKAALSAYNTGNYSLGFQNGYVAKFYGGKIRKVSSYEADILVQNNLTDGEINGNDQSDIATGTPKRRGDSSGSTPGEGIRQSGSDF